jgi:mono/diheme cytochrome c family protein
MKRLIALVSALALVSAPAFAVDKKIERLWKSKCAACHGEAGKGDTDKGKQMKIADFTTADFQKKTDADLKKAIEEGVKKEEGGVKKEMDPYKDELKPEQIDGLVPPSAGSK